MAPSYLHDLQAGVSSQAEALITRISCYLQRIIYYKFCSLTAAVITVVRTHRELCTPNVNIISHNVKQKRAVEPFYFLVRAPKASWEL